MMSKLSSKYAQKNVNNMSIPNKISTTYSEIVHPIIPS